LRCYVQHDGFVELEGGIPGSLRVAAEGGGALLLRDSQRGVLERTCRAGAMVVPPKYRPKPKPFPKAGRQCAVMRGLALLAKLGGRAHAASDDPTGFVDFF
jgi:hypothetical protein